MRSARPDDSRADDPTFPTRPMTAADAAPGGRDALVTQAALEAWGRTVARTAPLPLWVALRGPLGAGKSVLARAIARGAGVDSAMPSPTYNLRFAYEGASGIRVQHLDLYRLEDPDDVWELGWRELGEGREIVLVEWPERAESLLPADRWEVGLAFVEDPGLRRVTVAARGDAPAPPPLAAGGTDAGAGVGERGGGAP